MSCCWFLASGSIEVHDRICPRSRPFRNRCRLLASIKIQNRICRCCRPFLSRRLLTGSFWSLLRLWHLGNFRRLVGRHLVQLIDLGIYKHVKVHILSNLTIVLHHLEQKCLKLQLILRGQIPNQLLIRLLGLFQILRVNLAGTKSVGWVVYGDFWAITRILLLLLSRCVFWNGDWCWVYCCSWGNRCRYTLRISSLWRLRIKRYLYLLKFCFFLSVWHVRLNL